MEHLFPILGLAIFGSVLGLFGGVIVLSGKKWSTIISLYSVPFAAGVLLTVTLIDLLPEATHLLGELAFPIVFLSFFGSFILEQVFVHFHHHKPEHEVEEAQGAIALVIIGDTIHNFIDGISIAASYLINPSLGVIVAISTFLHEIPHEIGDFGIMLRAGYEKKTVFQVNLLSSLSTILGAIFVLIFTPLVTDSIGTFLAIAAGMFLYIGATDLLSQVNKEKENIIRQSIALCIGVLLMLIVINLIPHES